MDNTKSLKYVVRKGSALENLDLHKNKGKISIQSIVSLFDKLLFKKPIQTLGILILVFAVPLSLYIAVHEDLSNVGAINEGLYRVVGDDLIRLTPNKKLAMDISVESVGFEVPDYLSISVPEWLLIGKGAVDEDGDIMKSKVTLKGTAPPDSHYQLSLLIRSKVKTPVSCNGCDEAQNYKYGLYSGWLSTRTCEDRSPVWARHPLGALDSSNQDSICRRFENSCLTPSSWKTYSSETDCLGQNHSPEFVEVPEDIIFTFETDCDGELITKTQTLELSISAIDEDGDLVRFSVESLGDFVKNRQDSVETIIRKVSSGNIHYGDYKYTTKLTAEVDESLSQVSTSIKVMACDLLGECSNELIQIVSSQKDVCDLQLPETGNALVNLAVPVEEKVLISKVPIVWSVEGFSTYDLALKLYEKDCKSYISEIGSMERLSLNGNKGYSLSWDTSLVSDGEYCIKSFIRDSNGKKNWSASNSLDVIVDNSRTKSIINSLPERSSVFTGETYSHPLNEPSDVEYSVTGLPKWLTFENNKISGSTSVPGGYEYVLWAKPLNGENISQRYLVNVISPEKELPNLTINFPDDKSVIAGGGNNISWDLSIPEGEDIGLIKIYYSFGTGKWVLLGSYPSSRSDVDWDVSGLRDGKYSLKIEVTDEDISGTSYIYYSDSFYIVNNDISRNEDTSFPRLYNFFPDEKNNLTVSPDWISFSFEFSNRAEQVSDFEIKLNEKRITSFCEIKENKILCQLDNELEFGRHKVAASVTDDKNKAITEEVFFQIEEPGATTLDTQLPQTGAIEKEQVIVVALVITFTGLLMLIILGLFLVLWRNFRKEKRTSVLTNIAPPNENDITAPPPFVY